MPACVSGDARRRHCGRRRAHLAHCVPGSQPAAARRAGHQQGFERHWHRRCDGPLRKKRPHQNQTRNSRRDFRARRFCHRRKGCVAHTRRRHSDDYGVRPARGRVFRAAQARARRARRRHDLHEKADRHHRHFVVFHWHVRRLLRTGHGHVHAARIHGGGEAARARSERRSEVRKPRVKRRRARDVRRQWRRLVGPGPCCFGVRDCR